ncbi:MAG: DUF4352 domain-containing protein [Methanothrix sp.]|nr:DUF4352 domain-containing protein [Methanothrix sp.]
MRCLLPLLLLACTAAGYPLHGSNGEVNCTVFGSFKEPWPSSNSADLGYSVLDVDLALSGEDGAQAPRAGFTLTDGNDRVYSMSQEYTLDLKGGRFLIGFLVPTEAIPKSLTVEPSQGGRFSIPFPEPASSTDGSVTLTCYGVLATQTASKKGTVVLDVGLTNNGTESLRVSSSNFTLMDQFGWSYKSDARGLEPSEIAPNGTLRSGILFFPLSPLSRPVRLLYDGPGGPLSAQIGPEEEGCQQACAPAGEPEPSSLAGSIKATKARLAKVKGNISQGRDEL